MAYTWTLKDKIFGFFGLNAKVEDTFKDVDKKGIKERFAESLGEDYDEELGPLIDGFTDRLVNVKTIDERFIPHMESMVGNPIVIVDTPAFRRKMLHIWQSIVLIKSTRLSYEILLAMIGVTVDDIVLVDTESGFDSSYTFDDVRRFDSGAFCCRHYVLQLSGPVITDELLEVIMRIVLFLHPIDSELDGISYNGVSDYFDDYFSEYFA